MRTDLAHEKQPKPQGNYETIFCKELDTEKDIAALTEVLSKMLPELSHNQKILVAGLGNENITPDSLGVRAVNKVLATGHFASNVELKNEFVELGMKEVYSITPGVMAQTGIETSQQLQFIAKGIRPDCLLVVDSLACNSTQRLGTTIQLTDTGISPGSGVQNNRLEISQKIFGVPVIAIGVPTVIDWQEESLISGEPFMVVPRNIDIIVNHYARVISAAINRTLNPGLNESEIECLMMYT
ncbi:MAG: GPR endopeptidase [Oscillospiraceae bacterium]|nr:GPR endopeptidase [Oscillospiraceae bacterium]